MGDLTRVSVGETGGLSGEPLLQVVAPNGAIVDTDGGFTTGSEAVVQFTASLGGTYTAIVSDGSNDEAMTYRIRAVAVPGSPEIIAGRDDVLSNGQEVESSFPLGGFSIFEFQADVGDLTRVSVGETDSGTGFGAEPLLQVVAPNGAIVDTDGGFTTGSEAVVQFTASLGGTYTAIVSDGSNDEAMTYRIRAVAVPGSPEIIAGRDDVLSNGQEVESSFPLGGFSIFEFQADVGDLTRVSVGETGGLSGEPLLQVVAPNGAIVDTDGGFTTGSEAVVQFTASLGGTYTAIVSDGSNDEAMTYRIRAVAVPGSPEIIAGRDDVLSNGQEVESSFPLGGFSIFRFNVEIGDFATIDVEEVVSFSAEPLLQVVAPNGAIVDTDGGFTTGSEAVVQFTASLGGTYTAIVSDGGNDEQMSFAINATGVEAAPTFPIGDYNRDLVVDDEDYDIWAASFGAAGSGLPADGNGDGVVNSIDYLIWRENEGASSIQATSFAVATGAMVEVEESEDDQSVAPERLLSLDVSKRNTSFPSDSRAPLERPLSRSREDAFLLLAESGRPGPNSLGRLADDEPVSKKSRESAFERFEYEPLDSLLV